ncbi:MAG: arylsulfatase [Bacteroidetes bacterium]|nr:arylsulfatase [Bacteroidota bacterium]
MLKQLTLILLSVFLFSCTEKTSETKPNVIIILADDQGWGDLSASGNTNLSTPNIDELAETGISFDRFYVSPYCSATRAEMLTGRYYVRGGVSGTSAGRERLDLDETTMSRVFKDAGYATAAYGKWHNGMQPPYHPNARGFDDYYGFCSGHWGNYYSPMLEHNGEIVQGEGFIIDDFTDHGLAFMEENKDHPFFLYLPYNTPHGPFQVPDRWWEKFENMDPAMVHREPGQEHVQITRAALAMCENIDWNVGRITDKLEELGLSENTIILYLTDNGPASYRWNGGMKGKKGDTDEGGVRSPLFVKWEGTLEAGKTVPQIAGAMDLLPTLSDLAGIDYEPQKDLDGVSLKALMLEENPEWEERLIFSHCMGKTSARSQQYRLGHEGQLFDMLKDPGQHRDISDQEPEIKEELALAKEKWEREVLSELLGKDSRTFPIGHPDYSFTQIPARDGTAHGNIKRSNKFPNCSFFTNWTSLGDSITWESEVLESGDYEVELYYSCPAEDVGSVFELSFAQSKLRGKITEAHDPPLTGMEHDRAPRGGSFVKDFKRMPLGSIHLEKGEGVLTLKALEIPGSQVMDFRLLMLNRI